MYLKCDLKSFDLSSLGKFDVILIDPPLPEYHRRVSGIVPDSQLEKLSPWSFEELANLRVETLADQCCFLFLWVGSSEGLDKGRALLKKWNFRRCEDIVWIKTNKHNFNRKFVNDKDTLIHHTKEHCLVGIKGAVKRGTDGHFIHANIDTDVIVSEEPTFGSTEKPQELYRIIERFCLGRKRIELFGEDHNIRPGWLSLGMSLSSSNLDIEKYNDFFEGELCYPEVQGFQGGRYVGCTQEIENLRPRSPIRNSHSQNNFGVVNSLSNNMGKMNANLTNSFNNTNNYTEYMGNNNYSSNNYFNNQGNYNNFNSQMNNNNLTNGFYQGNNISNARSYNQGYNTNNNQNNSANFNNNHNQGYYPTRGNFNSNNQMLNNNFGNPNLNRQGNFMNNSNNIQSYSGGNNQGFYSKQSNLFMDSSQFYLNKTNGNMKNGNPNMHTGMKYMNNNQMQFEKQMGHQNQMNNFNYSNINNNSKFEENSNLNNLTNSFNYNQNS